MKFKDLEWKDIVSDNVIVSSHCMINLCGSVESAKNVAYRIYSNEMERIKKAVDYLVTT